MKTLMQQYEEIEKSLKTLYKEEFRINPINNSEYDIDEIIKAFASIKEKREKLEKKRLEIIRKFKS